MPIIRQDYDDILAVSYDGEVTGPEIIELNPQNLNVCFDYFKNNKYLQIKPLLLNPGDEFSIKAVVIDSKSDPKVIGRIVGGQIKKVEKLGPPEIIVTLSGAEIRLGREREIRLGRERE
jgi:hypothetical protein